MKDISIIVPAYNVEKYIKKCLDSLILQTKKEIEIIVVNDGSKDNTQTILDEYSKKYPDIIKVITQENKGQSIARNNGINIATGKYIAFVDSDDYVEEYMFEIMYNKAIEENYDVVACDVNCIYPDKEILISSGIDFCSGDLNIEEKKKLLLYSYPVVWNKIYKREIFNNKELLFEPNIWFEDVLFLYKLFPFINSIGVVKKTFYNYIQRENSITYTYNDKLYDINKVLNKIIRYYKEKEIIDEYNDIVEYIYTRYMFATFIKRLSKCKDKEKFNKGVKFAIKDVKEHYPNYKKNRFIKQNGAKGVYLKYFNTFLANIVYLKEKNRMN